jgi:hypothetical protein
MCEVRSNNTQSGVLKLYYLKIILNYYYLLQSSLLGKLYTAANVFPAYEIFSIQSVVSILVYFVTWDIMGTERGGGWIEHFEIKDMFYINCSVLIFKRFNKHESTHKV